jgi:site-specific recombinase XerD
MLFDDLWPTPERMPTLLHASRQHLESLAGKAPNTQRSYECGVWKFLEWLETMRRPAYKLPANGLQLNHLEQYVLHLLQRHDRHRRPTIDAYLAGVSSLVRYLVRRGWSHADLTVAGFREVRRELLGPRHYRSRDIANEIVLVVMHPQELPLPPDGPGRLKLLRDRALLLTLYCTGMRRGEIVTLGRADVDDGWADRALVLGKGEIERVVFFDEAAQHAIREYLAARPDSTRPLFLGKHADRCGGDPNGERRRLKSSQVYQIVKRHARAVGVKASPHMFRHLKASSMLSQNADISLVQDILGHAAPTTTKTIYARYDMGHLKEVFDRCSPSVWVAAARCRGRGLDR